MMVVIVKVRYAPSFADVALYSVERLSAQVPVRC